MMHSLSRINSLNFFIIIIFIIVTTNFEMAVVHSNGDLGQDFTCLQSFKASLKDSTNVLSSWRTSPSHREPPCNGSISSWTGVTCDNDRVSLLTVSNMGLIGSISPNLAQCTAMGTLDLSENQLSGEIPSSLGDLSNLVSLNLSANMLSGEIPSELSNCTYLNVLDLHGNSLEGPIPPTLGDLPRLEEFDVSNNGLSGEIPGSLAYNLSGGARFNATSFLGNKDLSGFPLPSGNGHSLSLLEIVGIGLASGALSLTLSFTAVCVWLKVSEQRRAAEEGKISDLVADP